MSTQVQSQSYTDDTDREPSRARPWLARLTLIFVSILVLSNLIAALMAAGYQIYHDGLIFPGVNVWGIDLSGMTPSEAATALQGRFAYPQTLVITFRDGDSIWQVTAGDLGVRFDVDRTVQAAYELGRQPGLIASLRQQAAAWRGGVTVSPVIVFDQISADRYLQQIALLVNRPMIDAAVSVQGLEVISSPSQVGRAVDIPATMDALSKQITTLESGEVVVVVIETPPQVASADDAAQDIITILSADLEAYIENPIPDDPGPWIASREALAGMLIIERVPAPDGQGEVYSVRLSESQLRAFLGPLVPELARYPVNARFHFNESTKELTPISPSRQGRELNVPATIQLINQMALTTNHRVPLVFNTTDPEIPDTSTAADLGITELISSATTYYAGSSGERKANIRTAAARFDGLVVNPSAEFSFNQHLGEVTPETGFETALIIFNGRTIEGVGGGVCQVSTTAFQAAFYAGFPITERVPHGYWVGYYDSGEGKGMDATVYSPLVDLRFVNDTPSHLLIETESDPNRSTVTFRFYSTSDGRTVVKDGPYIDNLVPHGPPLYEVNPDLPPGTVKKVDYAVNGFDATVNRIVYRNGIILFQDTFFSQYVPWQAVYQVPPGEVPPGAQTVPN